METHVDRKMFTVKFLKIRTPERIAVIIQTLSSMDLHPLHPKDAAGMANSVDPDQTTPLGAPPGAVWSGSSLFARAGLSKNLGSLRYYLAAPSYLITELFVFKKEIQ